MSFAEERIAEDFIAQLVAVRYARGLKAKDVAERMCCSRPNVSFFENSRRSPTLASIVRYAAAVGAKITVEAG